MEKIPNEWKDAVFRITRVDNENLRFINLLNSDETYKYKYYIFGFNNQNKLKLAKASDNALYKHKRITLASLSKHGKDHIILRIDNYHLKIPLRLRDTIIGQTITGGIKWKQKK